MFFDENGESDEFESLAVPGKGIPNKRAKITPGGILGATRFCATGLNLCHSWYKDLGQA